MRKFIIITFSLLFPIIGYSQSLNYAKQLLKEGEYKLAATQLRPLAEGGNAEAQYLAAQLFAEGKGVIKSIEQAEKYYTLAIDGGQKEAAIELVELFEKNKLQTKAAKLMEKLFNDSEEWKTTPLAYQYGLYLYHGYGNTSINKRYGWGLMIRSGYNVDSIALLKDEYFLNMIKNDEDWMYILCDYTWLSSGTPQSWIANYLDDAFQFIKSHPAEEYNSFFNKCNTLYKDNPKSEATAILLSMMYAEGVGTEKNYTKAKDIYSSAINDSMYDLLFNNLYNNSADGKDGHLKRNDFPEFWRVVLNDYLERKERWDYEKKKKDITFACSATMFKLVSVEAFKLVNGNIAVEFEVYNTSPNVSGRSTRAYSAGVRCEGKYYSKNDGVDLSYFIAENVGIKGHATTIFRIEIPQHLLPTSKVIESVSFLLDSHWKTGGVIAAQNVVWRNMK